MDEYKRMWTSDDILDFLNGLGGKGFYITQTAAKNFRAHIGATGIIIQTPNDVNPNKWEPVVRYTGTPLGISNVGGNKQTTIFGDTIILKSVPQQPSIELEGIVYDYNPSTETLGDMSRGTFNLKVVKTLDSDGNLVSGVGTLTMQMGVDLETPTCFFIGKENDMPAYFTGVARITRGNTTLTTTLCCDDGGEIDFGVPLQDEDVIEAGIVLHTT